MSPEFTHGRAGARRSETGVSLLLFGLAASPFAWIAQLLITYGLSSNVCSAAQGRGGFALGWSRPTETFVLVLVNLIFLGLAVLGGALSYWNWRRSRARTSLAGQPATTGQERTRFIASCGIMAAVAFGIAILFNTVEPLLIPLCWAT